MSIAFYMQVKTLAETVAQMQQVFAALDERLTALESLASKPESENDPRGAPMQSMPAANGEVAQVLPVMPCGVHEAVAQDQPADAGTGWQGQLPELCGGLQAPGLAQTDAVQTVHCPEVSDAPRGLQPASEGAVVLPAVPPVAAQKREVLTLPPKAKSWPRPPSPRLPIGAPRRRGPVMTPYKSRNNRGVDDA
jgi:hypothetical protein